MAISGMRLDVHRLREFGRILVEVLSYTVALTVVLTLLALILGISTGGGFVRGKELLFVFAWIVMAYATFKLWPRKSDAIAGSTGDNRTNAMMQSAEEIGWFHQLVQQIPPNRWIAEPHPSRRMSIGAKLFVTSLLMFLISFILEVRFDIT